MDLIQVPRNESSQRTRPLESFSMLGVSQLPQIGARRSHKRIEHQHHPPLVLPRKFPHNQPPRFRRHLPINEPRTIGRHVVAQRVELVPAAAKKTRHLAGQQRQHLEKLIDRLYARINNDLQIRAYLASLLEKPERKSRPNPKRILPVNTPPRKSQLHLLPHRAHSRNVRKKYRLSQDLRRSRLFLATDHPQRKRRPHLLLVPKFH